MPVRTLDPSDISDEELRQLLEELDQFRSARDTQEGGTCVLSVDGKELSIPDRLADEVIHLLSEVASGREVSVDAQETELTTTEAAELLNVSRPHLVDLLEEGEIPFHMTGSHRRLYRRDVLEYKQNQRQEAEEAMQKLADQAQDLDMGY
jgi:excisionase family DNA binding protein